MFPGWREDWHIVTGRTGDSADKIIAWLLWIVTAFVLFGILLTIMITIGSITQAVKG
jgi:hypothetical protein